MFQLIKRLLLPLSAIARARDHVSFDEERVTRTMADGRLESVRWDALLRVDILTTDEGPFVDDVFWILSAGDHGCAVPSEAEGMDALLERLQRLPGFDDMAVIEAMGCSECDCFTVWTRTPGDGAAA